MIVKNSINRIQRSHLRLLEIGVLLYFLLAWCEFLRSLIFLLGADIWQLQAWNLRFLKHYHLLNTGAWYLSVEVIIAFSDYLLTSSTLSAYVLMRGNTIDILPLRG